MTRFLTLGLIAATATANAQVIYSETFDDGNAASRWSAPVVSTFGGDPPAFDGQVDYAVDYSTLGIPAAPGSGGTTTGILFEANRTVDPGAGGFEGETIGIVPTIGGELPDGPYRVSVQAYFVVEEQNGGTTEFSLLGVHASDFNAPGDADFNDDLPFDFGVSNGNGLAYHTSGDSGAFNDFHRYEDPANAGSGTQTGLGSYDDRENADAASFPSIPDPISSGGPSEIWLDLVIERVGPIVTYSVDGTLIDTFNARFHDGGTILLGYADMFSSVATTDFLVGPDPTPFDGSDGPFGDDIPGFAHFVVFDNVTIESIVPEPTSAVLGALALVGVAARRRG